MPSPAGSKQSSRLLSSTNGIAALLLWMVISLAVAGNPAQNYFTHMDNFFFERIAKRFEPSGALRLVRMRRQLMDHIEHLTPGSSSNLGYVNDLFNHVPQVEDAQHWGVADYWASPAEFVASNGGDCEDFVIAKYFALREGGIPAEKMRLTYVKSFQGGKIENHMVLAYYPAPDAEPLLLDNLQPQMLPASQRPDLLPVYEFNGELADKFSGPAMRKWDSLVEHMNKEHAQ